LDFDAQARVLVDWLEKYKYYFYGENEKDVSVQGQLLMLLPRINDNNLKNRIEAVLVQSVPKKQ
jgi:hypothetical protein